MKHSHVVAALALVLAASCGGREGQPAGDTQQTVTPPPAAAGDQTPDAGRKVIVVEATTDEKGNYFSPNSFEAHRGDVIRFTLKVGVHNVHFLADSNAGKSGYPAAPSDMLQLPGQTYDVKVTFPEGTYYFQCDPHAALGMSGHVKVED
jgi:plastocyanin